MNKTSKFSLMSMLVLALTLTGCSGCAKAEDKDAKQTDDAVRWGAPAAEPAAPVVPAGPGMGAAPGSFYSDEDFHSMFDEMNRMHQAMLNSMGGWGMGGSWTRPVRPSGFMTASSGISADMAETDKEHIISCELPGVSKEDVRIDLEGDTLIVQAVRNAGTDKSGDENGRTFHYRERSYGTVQRRFQVGHGVDPKKIKASLKDGVLTVHVPKGGDGKPSSIPIE